jgi:tetratricopeptide (TPR) repeat protein
MVKKIKIDKKKLKEPDEFISYSSRLVNYLTENWKIAVIAIVIIFGGLGAYTGIRYYKNYTNTKNQEALDRAIESFKKGNGLDSEGVALLEKISKKSGKSWTSLAARLYLGNHFFKQALYDRALEEYESIVSSKADVIDPLVKELALLGAGYSLEQLHKYPEAIKYFMEVADDSNSIFGDSALISAARCYEQEGKSESAVELYKRVEAEHPDSPYLSEVKSILGERDSKKPD